MTMRRSLLRVEELGQRVLPSASPLSAFGTVPFMRPLVHQQSSPQPASVLHGSGIAVYTTSQQIPDTGTAYHLQGVGSFGAVGFVTITGDLHSVGFIMQGHATGTLTFSNAKGSVTLDLTGPAQSAFAPLPQRFQYQIVGGTGAYAHLHAQGTVQLQTLAAAPGTPGFGVFAIRI
jgi:hypothetical protein